MIIRTTCVCLGIENDGHQAYVVHMAAMQKIVDHLKNGEFPSLVLGTLIIPAELKVPLPTFTVKPDEDGKIDHNWIVSYTMNHHTLRNNIIEIAYNTLHIFQGTNSIIYRWCPVDETAIL